MIVYKLPEGNRLGEAFWNATLFTNAKSATEGRALLILRENELQVVACDNFIVIEDSVPLASAPFPLDVDYGWEIDLKDLQTAEKALRESPAVGFELADDSLLRITQANGAVMDVVASMTSHPDLWNEIYLYLDSEAKPGKLESQYCYWTLNPQRLQNLYRCKVTDTPPIDFRFVDQGERGVWQFLLGEIRGAICLMDREKVRSQGHRMWEESK